MRNGHDVSFLGLNTRSELLHYDPAARLFLRNDETLSSAQFVRYSRDGNWVAWISRRGSTLWRSRTNTSERLQLTASSLRSSAAHMREIATVGNVAKEASSSGTTVTIHSPFKDESSASPTSILITLLTDVTMPLMNGVDPRYRRH